MSSRAMPLTTLRAEERRDEHRVVGLDLGRAVGDVGVVVVAGVALAEAPGQLDLGLAGHHAPVGVVGSGRALDLAQAVHDAEALEGVLAVEQAALVDLAEVALDVGAGERGAAEQHRDVGRLALVQLLEVVPHDQRALHQQAAHADGVGLDLERPCRSSR